MEIQNELFKLQDLKYKEFHCKLMPTVSTEKVIGVRTPDLRKLSKEIIKKGQDEAFIKQLPHKYYEENNLHGFIISEIKEYEKAIYELNRFLPYIDNWATCDLLKPKVFKKNREKLIKDIKKWINSKEVYIIRFGIEMLMTHFLDEDFNPEYLELVLKIKNDEYYVKMMIAWYFATALSKQWDSTISVIKENKLPKWTHNKTIQKACESYRITNEQKEKLRKYRM